MNTPNTTETKRKYEESGTSRILKTNKINELSGEDDKLIDFQILIISMIRVFRRVLQIRCVH
jgi:hypothetical protein